MITDYHTHLEYLNYCAADVQEFFNHCDELGFSEHSHTFPEFKSLYFDELILDDSPVGTIQRAWLSKNKFKHSLDDYFEFCAGLPVKIGLELCNFHNQAAVNQILQPYAFDYIIGSVHFINGWGFDNSQTLFEWNNHNLRDLWEMYTAEIERLCYNADIDILGHPFNIRLFKHFPNFDVTKYLLRAADAIKANDIALDVNTGTLYRYPVAEISPFPDFMRIAANFNIPITINSDAHQPQDCAKFFQSAFDYVKAFGYNSVLHFNNRVPTEVNL